MWPFMAFLMVIIDSGQGQQISGYGPVDLAELNPLTLSWNQVHFLVRENLLAVDELRDEQDAIYKDLHDCFGLERCRKQENFMGAEPPTHGDNLRAGALLATLRQARLGLEGQHSVLESGIRQQQRIYDQRQQNRGGGSTFQGSRSGSGGSSGSSGGSSSTRQGSSYSRRTYTSSSSSSSSSSSGGGSGYGDGYSHKQNNLGAGGNSNDYDYDQGPVANRG